MLGILLYGYNKEDAGTIKVELEGLLASEITMYSGSTKEEEVVGKIIQNPPIDEFQEKENRVMLLLGFSDQHVSTLLKGFPKQVPRPIFCGLTEQNMGWTINYLVAHLLEEDKHWKAQRSENKNSG